MEDMIDVGIVGKFENEDKVIRPEDLTFDCSPMI